MTKNLAYGVKRKIDETVEVNGLNLSGKAPKIQVDPSPWMRPILTSGGKMLGSLARAGVGRNRVNPEWNQDNVSLMRIYALNVKNNVRPLLILTLTKGWVWEFEHANWVEVAEELNVQMSKDDIVMAAQ